MVEDDPEPLLLPLPPFPFPPPPLPLPLPELLFPELELCATELTAVTFPRTVLPPGSCTVTRSPTLASLCSEASRSTVTTRCVDVVARTASPVLPLSPVFEPLVPLPLFLLPLFLLPL